MGVQGLGGDGISLKTELPDGGIPLPHQGVFPRLGIAGMATKDK
jgi:hypothetical protein